MYLCTMKTLYIVRHAKSSWKNPELSDAERPLLEKGKKRTRRVIEYLIQNEVHTDLIYSSHAIRARETARIIGHAIQYPLDKIFIDRTIYFGNSESIRRLFFDLPSDASSLMIVGHNPTMTNFANMFLDKKLEWLPTSAVLALKFNASNWLNVLNTTPEILFYIYPSMLKGKSKTADRNTAM